MEATVKGQTDDFGNSTSASSSDSKLFENETPPHSRKVTQNH